MTNICIATSSDDSYSQHLGTMLCSIFENKFDHTHIETIYVLDGGISMNNMNKLRKLARSYNFDIKFIRMNNDTYYKFNRCGLNDNFHCAFFRISIPELVSPYLNKILYLDSDIIVRGDLTEFWNTNISKSYLAAIPDPYAAIRQKIYSWKGDDYFNSGVMLINLKKWRNENISRKLHDFISKHNDDLVFLEQDGLNALLHENFVRIRPQYNCMSYFFNMKDTPNPFEQGEFYSALKKPMIVHYTGDKPWIFHSRHPLKKWYYKYLWKTPWRFYIPPDMRYKQLKYDFLNQHTKLFKILRTIKKPFKMSIKILIS